MEKIRIDRFLASQLNISRSDAKKVIKAGQVAVNGVPVTKADFSFDADGSTVLAGGREIRFRKHLYIMLNKPAGVISASEDASERTVVDILPDELKRQGLFPAGRLDRDTTGFVLITDDGAFAHDILAPGRHVPKNYDVWVKRKLTPEEEERFRSGMTVGSTTFREAGLVLAGYDEEEALYRYSVTLHEGRYHQIKIMFAALDDRLVRLHRNSIGGLVLDPSLSPGQARELSPEEVARIAGKNI